MKSSFKNMLSRKAGAGTRDGGGYGAAQVLGRDAAVVTIEHNEADGGGAAPPDAQPPRRSIVQVCPSNGRTVPSIRASFLRARTRLFVLVGRRHTTTRRRFGARAR